MKHNYNPTPNPMIPEIEKDTVVSEISRQLHRALRRRTWKFRKNARLAELLPQKPVKRRDSLGSCLCAMLSAMLLCRA